MTTREWWESRWIETAALSQQYDVTRTWTDEQRDEDTDSIADSIKDFVRGRKRLVDFGCAKARFAPFAEGLGLSYLGADILPKIGEYVRNVGFQFHLLDGDPIPEELDGDTALFCRVIQHLDEADALQALMQTRARRIIVVEGAWKTTDYMMSRPPSKLQALLGYAGCVESTAFAVESIVTHKIVVGDRADA